MCRVLRVSHGGYYAWRGREVSPRAKASAALLEKIKRVHLSYKKRYGSPRIYRQLRNEGFDYGRQSHCTINAPKRDCMRSNRAIQMRDQKPVATAKCG